MIPDYEDQRIDLAAASEDADTLAILASDRSDSVRESVASNPHAAIETLWRLSEDSDDFIREAVARNPTTPSELVEKLALDPDLATREAALKRLPPGSKLADEVRRSIAVEKRYLLEERKNDGNTLRRMPAHKRAAAIARLEQVAGLGGARLIDFD
ncbi:hypothetical protein DOP62_14195 (plasmid) [Synechococcus elongatus PCC 11801]|uniref:Uncharacterized protein n=1 Tax=Synechococcus elongatus PCC 11801 TaxID=2219813 RepID=A0ACD5A303_SYNEL